MASLPSKPSRVSRVEMTEIVMPEDTNPFGHIFGGRVMTLIDKAAAIAAMRHARSNVVTASVDRLVFRAPVRLGQILRVHAAVNAAFSTSMEVGVKVLSEDPHSGRQAHCCSAYVTMVALDRSGRPAQVAAISAAGATERRRLRAAAARRRSRLRERRLRERRRAD